MKRDYKIEVFRSIEVESIDGVLDGILSLYSACYGEKAGFNPFIRSLAKERNPESWIWKNVSFPLANNDNNLIALAFCENELVGSTSYISKPGVVNGEEALIMQSNDSMVHPSHRGKGLFCNLVKRLNQKTFELTGANIFYSFPNEINPRITHQHEFSTRIVDYVPFMIKSNLSTDNEKPLHSIDILTEIPEEIEKVWTQMTSGKMFGIKKTKEYLTWRYLLNPHNHSTYRIISLRDDSSSLAVVKLYSDISRGEIVGHVVDLVSLHIDSTELLIKGIEAYLISYTCSHQK